MGNGGESVRMLRSRGRDSWCSKLKRIQISVSRERKYSRVIKERGRAKALLTSIVRPLIPLGV